MLCDSLDGREVWGDMDTCMCMTESLHSSPETMTTLLTGYTPIQNATLLIGYVCVLSHLRVSNSVLRCRLEPARLLGPWDSPGKNTGVAYNALPQRDPSDPGMEPSSLTSALVK